MQLELFKTTVITVALISPAFSTVITFSAYAKTNK